MTTEQRLEDSRETIRRIVDCLGPPSHGGRDYLIYQGDCLVKMREMSIDLISLIVTSPPYNIGKEYENQLSACEYLDWSEKWIAETYRILQSNGAFWLNLGYMPFGNRAKAIPIPYLLWNRIPYFLIQEIVWNYGAGVAGKTFFSPRNEKFLWYVKDQSQYIFNLDHIRDPNVQYPKQKKNGKLKCNVLGKNPTDVWHFPKVTSGRNRSSKERTAHPAQFPIAVIDRIIKACSNPGDIVFDPFLGSGTVIEAAIRNGRIGVGIEINSDYVQIAQRRMLSYERKQSQDNAQGALF